ncbi:hypothetical protein SADUNF_Sadunf16G0003800 [Salix dunnii]|uniref:Reverse transcriptase zinc-binding domain-containing protein n=1 Tax=Salix dunnii TaxID=1413687 RepID=A0A835MNY4_9ROSI|nr:hypothetical protein SADUNF_Sadunf16G0003800 [Salix dunnii]
MAFYGQQRFDLLPYNGGMECHQVHYANHKPITSMDDMRSSKHCNPKHDYYHLRLRPQYADRATNPMSTPTGAKLHSLFHAIGHSWEDTIVWKGRFQQIHHCLCMELGKDYPYSNMVWSNLTANTSLQWAKLRWGSLLPWASMKFKGRRGYTNLIIKHILATTMTNSQTKRHLEAKLILATVVYFIWFERNNRLFNQVHKSAATLAKEIYQLIRLHLATIKINPPLTADTKAR